MVAHLPEELLIQVLSHLYGKDISRAVCATQVFANVRESVWRAACERRWPALSQASSAATQWQRQHNLLELREKEVDAVPSVQAIYELQKVVDSSHRMILTEWLTEVSWEWQLESTIIFKAVNYLDWYLSQHTIEAFEQVQLVGIACLRAAMGDTVRRLPRPVRRLPRPVRLTDQDINLDAQCFAHVTASAYTPEQVESMTESVVSIIPEHVKDAPNAKMFLQEFRSLWYRANLSIPLSVDEMQVYALACFFLQLSLLDLSCTAYSPSMIAAASLSYAFEQYNKESWPQMLQQYSAYNTEEIQSCKDRLKEVDATTPADEFRQVWWDDKVFAIYSQEEEEEE